jgi:hypothetical protein
MEIIQPTQYAVFLCDVQHSAPLTPSGHYLDPEIKATCLIFASLAALR